MALDEHEFDRTYDKIKVLGQGNYGKFSAHAFARKSLNTPSVFHA